MADNADWDAKFAAMPFDAAKRHVFLCVGPDCCATEAGAGVWECLKRKVGDLRFPVLRTKAACLRICTGGPWMVVYPEGVWYGQLTVERCERIVREHLEGGRPVEEWVIRRHPLG